MKNQVIFLTITAINNSPVSPRGAKGARDEHRAEIRISDDGGRTGADCRRSIHRYSALNCATGRGTPVTGAALPGGFAQHPHRIFPD
ncbi:hypothetical protein EBL_c22950 [Shimwellia blattae DSM 4481 = NBRC 105725]|uniref:Uncharacterized protein n=1 Tax=Shimwellia blattae (strain ATCC 29907 / DSM 4481 / JCM 1650 / NBRC 105725 / CDC 9005-74) TaxID=630626 RepID=I2BA32_SHIBC|nr:hypothetical protein EBL_c22950 [Shimwellia blattae DSM 4481 = NBRC 105725]